MNPTIVAAVLVGGLSRRMGRPKALLRIGETTLIERTVAIARAVADDVILVGHPPFALPAGLSELTIVEDLPASIGPLGGLHAALSARPQSNVLLLACDMPNITAEFLRRMFSKAGENGAIFVVGGAVTQLHPCCAALRPSALPEVKRRINAAQHAMTQLASALKMTRIEIYSADAHFLHNLNRPEDLATFQ